MLESHPSDSRIRLDRSGTCQTLTGRMGTGGGGQYADGDGTGEEEYVRVIERETVVVQGNVVDRSAKQGGNGWLAEPISYTINTVDRHAVAFKVLCDDTVQEDDMLQDRPI